MLIFFSKVTKQVTPKVFFNNLIKQKLGFSFPSKKTLNEVNQPRSLLKSQLALIVKVTTTTDREVKFLLNVAIRINNLFGFPFPYSSKLN